MDQIEQKMKAAAAKLRKIREQKGLTRDKFCEPMGENSEYWGVIERGEQLISLPKLILVCETYHIPLDQVLNLDSDEVQDTFLKNEIYELVDRCGNRQMEMIKKFIEDIVMTV